MNQHINDKPPVDAPAAVPAAAPVDSARYVLENDDDDSKKNFDENSSTTACRVNIAEPNPFKNESLEIGKSVLLPNDAGNSVPKSPFEIEINDNNGRGRDSLGGKGTKNSDDPSSDEEFDFDSLIQPRSSSKIDDDHILDEDLDRLLGPLPNLRHRSDLHDDLDGFYGSSRRSNRHRNKNEICPCCPRAVQKGPWQAWLACVGSSSGWKVGNMIVVLPRCYEMVGFGVVGPHWFGPLCCQGLLSGATLYYAPLAYRSIGVISTIICLLFFTVGTVSLLIVSCSDPGVVKSIRGGGMDGRGGLDGVGVGRNGYAGVSAVEERPGGSAAGGRDWSNWRYCDLCSVYQPPSAVHCPECNVCIEGYDHHCPWMGTCIGKKNFTSFLVFNMTWLFYLFYATAWVTFIGPDLFCQENCKKHDHDDV
eukprot:CAMPEP_0171428264 /NCGR_PEP_ID=MMETSP0881-20121228/5136_1 /TAXON_ID=67004 /ORGANISM="Thalassiosira weissflogii, Strain CCMP1336" /LENGTH=419 /DNA_ID=CAMNT_0011948027 /DNA_START=17 /DNA_END=1276 /DNA_ORIENTATION=-